ncbi:Jag family protein [Actinophytocola gossypii]|uniref:Jag family protein n=1 Tax=Actinophytocola gossypii TaxID=2812003 RepID=UPI0021A76BA2|nr:R3H domain-containing nucleic acid-binding protein [Actinophytocola gossypii]
MPETVQESGTDQVDADEATVVPTAGGETDTVAPTQQADPAESDSDGDTDSDTDAEDSDEDGDGDDERGSEDLLVREGDIAGDYLERLLDLVDYDGDIDLDVEAGRAVVSIDGGDDLEKLVGPRGNVLEALQELTRLAVQQETGTRSRLMLDIAGWRADRRQELRDLGRATAERVLAGGDERVRLQPMTPFERKVVHDAVATFDGVHSESEGEDPRRRVVVFRQT